MAEGKLHMVALTFIEKQVNHRFKYSLPYTYVIIADLNQGFHNYSYDLAHMAKVFQLILQPESTAWVILT